MKNLLLLLAISALISGCMVTDTNLLNIKDWLNARTGGETIRQFTTEHNVSIGKIHQIVSLAEESKDYKN